MKTIKTFIAICFLAIIGFVMVACGKTEGCNVKEKVSLATTMLGEVEFDNSENVKLKQDCGEVIISGQIDAMSNAQIAEFGLEDVTHVVVLKFEFDNERTLSCFEIKGATTKVYSTDTSDENYVGSISELLDSEDGEDAYCYLILSANTKEYSLTARYSDESSSEIMLKIDATLVTASAE